MDDDLINLANRARSEYNKAQEEAKKVKAEKEAKLKAKEQEERLQEIAKKDKERKTALYQLQTKENDLLNQKREAEVSLYFC